MDDQYTHRKVVLINTYLGNLDPDNNEVSFNNSENGT